jgi:AcrR family transcriptional regulator
MYSLSANGCKVMGAMAATTRQRNPRGEGSRLREEIVEAAAELLEEHGDPAAVSLRAIARRAGISAPSIYGHFEDREAIMAAVVERAFAALTTRLHAATEGIEDPAVRLHAGCAAYVAFAQEAPETYGVLYQLLDDGEPAAPATSLEELAGGEAFAILLDGVQACVDAGASTAPSVPETAMALWVALHGYASLRTCLAAFPWPEHERTVTTLVDRLAWL